MKKKIFMLALVLPLLAGVSCSGDNQPKKNSKRMGIVEFFKRAFSDMKEDARAQHEVDKANFAAAKAEAKAQFEAAKRIPDEQRQVRQQAREEQIAAAKAREAEANERMGR